MNDWDSSNGLDNTNRLPTATKRQRCPTTPTSTQQPEFFFRWYRCLAHEIEYAGLGALAQRHDDPNTRRTAGCRRYAPETAVYRLDGTPAVADVGVGARIVKTADPTPEIRFCRHGFTSKHFEAYVGNDPANKVDPNGMCSKAALGAALTTSVADGPVPVGEVIGVGIAVADCGYRVYKLVQIARAPSVADTIEDIADPEDGEEQESEKEEDDEDEYWEDQFPEEEDRKKNRERRNQERRERPNDPEEKEARQRENEERKRLTGRGGDEPAPDDEEF